MKISSLVRGRPAQARSSPTLGRASDAALGTAEEFILLSGAKVAAASYVDIMADLIGHDNCDFLSSYSQMSCAECRVSGAYCTDAIDQWLIDNFAVVSKPHLEKNAVNSEISQPLGSVWGYRPRFYGRAALAGGSHLGGQYVDLKGSGVAPGIEPVAGEHTNGLEYLGAALADYFYGGLVSSILRRSGTAYQAVKTYAVLDLGFDIIDGKFGRSPAGLHVRAAHDRSKMNSALPPSGSDAELIGLHIELILRSFGLTSTCIGTSIRFERDGAGRPVALDGQGTRYTSIKGIRAEIHDQYYSRFGSLPFEFANVQLTDDYDWTRRSASIIDFGHFDVRDRFKTILATRVGDRAFCVGTVVDPSSQYYVQPHPGLRLRSAFFGRDAVNAFSFTEALKVRAGRSSSGKTNRMVRRALFLSGSIR